MHSLLSSLAGFFFSFSRNQIVGTAVNLLIIALGIWAVWELRREDRKIRADRIELDRFAERATGSTEPAQIYEVSRRSLPKNHLAARRVEVLRDLHGAGADIEPSALAALAVAELDRTAKNARWVSSNVVLLGLAGTLAGLTQAVLQAQPMLGQIVDGPTAVNAVIGTFSGLQTAFSTTLMGIFWAIGLGLYIGRVRGRQGAFLERLEEVSLVRLVPYFRTSPALAMVEAAKKLSALEQHIGASLTEVVGQLKTQGLALTKVVEDSIGDLIQDTRSTGQSLRQTVETSLGDVVHETQKRGVALTTTVDRSLATLIEDMRNGIAAMLGRLDATHQAAVALLGDPTADPRSLAQNLAVLKQGLDVMHAAAQRMAEMTPAIEEAIARQVDRQSRDLHETMHAYVGDLTRSVERQDAIIEDGLVKIGEGFPRFGELILDHLEKQGQTLASSLDIPYQRIAAALQEQSRNIAALEQAAEKLRDGAASLNDRGTQDREAARELKEAAAELGVQVREIGGQLQQLERSVASAVRPGTEPPRPLHVPTQAPGVIVPPGAYTPTIDAPVVGKGAAPGGGGGVPQSVKPISPDPTIRPTPSPGLWARLRGRSK